MFSQDHESSDIDTVPSTHHYLDKSTESTTPSTQTMHDKQSLHSRQLKSSKIENSTVLNIASSYSFQAYVSQSTIGMRKTPPLLGLSTSASTWEHPKTSTIKMETSMMSIELDVATATTNISLVEKDTLAKSNLQVISTTKQSSRINPAEFSDKSSQSNYLLESSMDFKSSSTEKSSSASITKHVSSQIQFLFQTVSPSITLISYPISVSTTNTKIPGHSQSSTTYAKIPRNFQSFSKLASTFNARQSYFTDSALNIPSSSIISNQSTRTEIHSLSKITKSPSLSVSTKISSPNQSVLRASETLLSRKTISNDSVANNINSVTINTTTKQDISSRKYIEMSKSIVPTTVMFNPSVNVNITNTSSVRLIDQPSHANVTSLINSTQISTNIMPSKASSSPIPSSSVWIEPYYFTWGNWSDCSLNCGGGYKTRIRKCSEENGCDNLGSNVNISACNMHKCNGKS